MKILVTGATGGLGSKVVESLRSSIPTKDFAVGVRDPGKADEMAAQGIEVRKADYEDPSSLDSAFKGVEKLLLISTMGDNPTRIRQHLNAVAAAKRARVQFLAYTSAAKADTSSLWLAEVHRVTEDAIRQSDIPFCILRNNWYLENEMGAIQGALAGAPIATSAGEGRVSWATREDYAKAAAAVLLGTGHENKVYELSGPSATYPDLAAVLSRILGHEVPVQQYDDAGMAAFLAGSGMPDFLVDMIVGIQAAIRKGALDVKSRDFETLLGRPVTPLKTAVEQILKRLEAESPA